MSDDDDEYDYFDASGINQSISASVSMNIGKKYGFAKKNELTKQELDGAVMIAKYAFGRESQFLHTNTWNWAKMRPWLVEGKHGMHKLAREKLQPLGNWLIENNINEYDPHASITLIKAVELI